MTVTHEPKIIFSSHKAEDYLIPKSSSICNLDLGKLEFPLIMRQWRKGDYFYPFGMKSKKKKLSDFFIDLKLSLPEKESTFILQSGDKIAAVLGYRIDDRFRISASTQMVLRVEIQK